MWGGECSGIVWGGDCSGIVWGGECRVRGKDGGKREDGEFLGFRLRKNFWVGFCFSFYIGRVGDDEFQGFWVFNFKFSLEFLENFRKFFLFISVVKKIFVGFGDKGVWRMEVGFFE